MEENIVIAPNPSGNLNEPVEWHWNNVNFLPNELLSHGRGRNIIVKEGWNGNFLPNEHMTKFLSGLMTQQEVGFLFSDNNGSMGVINLLDGLGLVDIKKAGGFEEYTAYLHALSGVNVDQYDMLIQLGLLETPAPQIII